MSDLSLANVIVVSVSQAQAGVGEYNTSNIAIFSRETRGGGFGNLGYKIYLDPTEVATDFGTDSETFEMANAIFSQKPNILAGNGYLVVIPFADTDNVTAVQHIAFSGTPASGHYELNFAAGVTAQLQWNADLATTQTAIRTLPGLGNATVSGFSSAGYDVAFTDYPGAAALFTFSDVSLQTSEPENIVVTATTTTAGTTQSTETLATAITRTAGLVQYFGVLAAEITVEADMLAAAAVVLPLNKIAFFPMRDPAVVQPGGSLDLLRSGGFQNSRGLFYGSDNDGDCLIMGASYAGRGLSVNFNGSNTTITMHLKDLLGVQPDPSMTQTLLNLCLAAGADTYVSLQGVAKTFCSGLNRFFDQIYNQEAFVGAIQVAGFNYLAEASTKIPQTEAGMSGLKGAYRQVCQQYVGNEYVAPGTWNSATTFGNQEDFLANITQLGYYIYSTPIALQSQAQRVLRAAPLVQIAIKEAGAIHSSDVIVTINA